MKDININDEKYKIALSEVDDILYFTDDSVKSQIPTSFLNFIKQNKDENYISNINPYLEIKEQNVSEEAKAIMALIYRSYIASDEEKSEYQRKDKAELNRLEEEKKQKYNPENIFKNNSQEEYKEELADETEYEDEYEEEEDIEPSDLIEIEKIGIIEKIRNFFKNLFNKNK